MNGIFVDTSGWANLFMRTEPYHERALRLIRAAHLAHRRIVTTNYVLAELSALLLSPLRVPRRSRITLLNRIRTAEWVDVLHIGVDDDAHSWTYLGSRQDKDFSLVDCSSFVLMQKERLYESLTSDAHFEQAGFIRLLK